MQNLPPLFVYLRYFTKFVATKCSSLPTCIPISLSLLNITTVKKQYLGTTMDNQPGDDENVPIRYKSISGYIVTIGRVII